MSKENWEDLAWDEDDSKTVPTNNNNNNDEEVEDWETFDVENLKDEEEEKKKLEQERIKRENEEKIKQEQQRKKIEAEKLKQQAKLTTASSTGSQQQQQTKKLSGMMQNYQTQISDYNETLDLFQGTQKPRIEILQPKDKKDFEEFADILTDKILEFYENEHYALFVKILLEKISIPLTTDQMKDVQKLVNTLVTKKTLADKEAKKVQPVKKQEKKSVKVDFSDDPFADIGTPVTATTGNYDDDEDFM